MDVRETLRTPMSDEVLHGRIMDVCDFVGLTEDQATRLIGMLAMVGLSIQETPHRGSVDAPIAKLSPVPSEANDGN